MRYSGIKKFNTHACVTQHTQHTVCMRECVCLPLYFVYILVLFDLIFFSCFEVGENAATTRGVADATATKNVTDA